MCHACRHKKTQNNTQWSTDLPNHHLSFPSLFVSRRHGDEDRFGQTNCTLQAKLIRLNFTSRPIIFSAAMFFHSLPNTTWRCTISYLGPVITLPENFLILILSILFYLFYLCLRDRLVNIKHQGICLGPAQKKSQFSFTYCYLQTWKGVTYVVLFFL